MLTAILNSLNPKVIHVKPAAVVLVAKPLGWFNEAVQASCLPPLLHPDASIQACLDLTTGSLLQQIAGIKGI